MLLSSIADPSEPEGFNATTLDDTSVKLSWRAPIHPNGVIKLYQLKYKCLDDPER